MVFFTSHGSAILAIQRHVKNASAKLLGHLCLQSQAFYHPHFNAAVVVAYRQRSRCGLCAEKYVAGVLHKD
jgi:hypothetical protein